MSVACVARPQVVLPGHKVSTDEILDYICARHTKPDKQLAAITRAVGNCGVATRYFTRPLDEVAAPLGVQKRADTAFADALDLAEEAAQRALVAAGLEPGDVDAIVTSHTTSWQVPQLDIRLMNRLGLRRHVRRIPLATLACAGGAQALILARDYLKANPGAVVLVVVAEVLSTIHHHGDDTLPHMIYKALFGDSAGAVLVTDTPSCGAGFTIDDTFEHVLAEPDDVDRYWGRIDSEGIHFDSTRKAPRAAHDALPNLTNWMGQWRPGWGVIHTGGPGIITEVADKLDLTLHDARHSTASLHEVGNLGGVAVLDVLARTHSDPPVDGADGLLVGFGPGFVTAACRGTWRSEPALAPFGMRIPGPGA